MEKIIEISGLKYTYPDGTVALDGVDLEVYAGETLGLIGPNGAGKSTLLLHLNGILTGNGEIKILGGPLNKSRLKQIRAKIGMVFQDPDDQLFLTTVFDDVAFGPLNLGLPEEEVRRRVKMALSEVEMEESVSKSAHHLSLGEKKRVAIATVLSMDPEILVMDEPTSNLDPRARRHLIQLLRGFNKTTIIASHDINLIWELCERAVVMNKGKIVADGPREELLADEALLFKYGLEPPASITQER